MGYRDTPVMRTKSSSKARAAGRESDRLHGFARHWSIGCFRHSTLSSRQHLAAEGRHGIHRSEPPASTVLVLLSGEIWPYVELVWNVWKATENVCSG